MARVTYHGESFDVPDSNTVLLDYYRGEDATVEVGVQGEAPRLPVLFDGEEYVPAPVDGEPAPTVESVEAVDVPEPVDGDVQPAQDVPAVPPVGESDPGTADAASDPQPGPTPDPAGD